MANQSKGKIIVPIVIVILIGIIVLALSFFKSNNPRKTILNISGNIYVEELSFFDGKDKIYGKVCVPSNLDEDIPLVIYCHDLGKTSDSAVKLQQTVTSTNHGLYSFDFRGGAESSRSDGKVEKMSVVTEEKDLAYIIKQLKKNDHYDLDDLILIGEGQGAFVAAMYAIHNPKNIKGLILLSPAFHIPEDARNLYDKKRQIKNGREYHDIFLGKRYFKDVYNMHPYKNMNKFKNDVLIIEGTNNSWCDSHWAKDAAENFPNASLEIIANGKHELLNNSKVKTLIKDFISEVNPK